MKNNDKSPFAVTLIALTVAFGACLMVGCEEKGPMEKAGEDIDEGIEEVTDGIKDATN